MFLLIAIKRIFGGIGGFFGNLGNTSYVLAWDFGLFLLNLISFKRKVGKVTLQGHPGFGGVWPEYIAPQETDSRSACPALNALSNHGMFAILECSIPSCFCPIPQILSTDWTPHPQVFCLGMGATSPTLRWAQRSGMSTTSRLPFAISSRTTCRTSLPGITTRTQST